MGQDFFFAVLGPGSEREQCSFYREGISARTGLSPKNVLLVLKEHPEPNSAILAAKINLWNQQIQDNSDIISGQRKPARFRLAEQKKLRGFVERESIALQVLKELEKDPGRAVLVLQSLERVKLGSLEKI